MKRNSRIIIILVFAIASIAIVTWQFMGTSGGKLSITGSTTVLPINQECARLYMQEHPEVRISAAGGGSGAGIQQVGEGFIDIGASSRDIKSSEFDKWPDLEPIAIAKDSIAIIIHPSNSINDLTMEEVAKIFAGEITNWIEVGGENLEINLFTREEGSGTRAIFEELVMAPFGKDIAGNALVKSSNGEIRATVSTDEYAISYISLGYIDETVKAIMIDGIEPNIENVLSENYPIIRNLWLITKGEPSILEQSFLNFVLSETGQEVVEDMGYIRVAY